VGRNSKLAHAGGFGCIRVRAGTAKTEIPAY
jgi:hypothetical protein